MNLKHWIGLMFAVFLMSGCGTDQYVTVQGTTTISKGQELTDLQRAFTDGAITQSEYDNLRARILSRPN